MTSASSRPAVDEPSRRDRLRVWEVMLGDGLRRVHDEKRDREHGCGVDDVNRVHAAHAKPLRRLLSLQCVGTMTVDSRRADATPPQNGATSLRLYVVVPARVKEWLAIQAEREGLSTSAFVRQQLTRAYVERTTHEHDGARAL